ncbi:MAG: nucleotidyltransferase domain-containing protein [Dysgonamonadaceae bacterium]|jgi:predicted nucleotidyltransferase|nr:nucleotidyltransferase domain-containing protein [Dysgonamonadaceae bacterium]
MLTQNAAINTVRNYAGEIKASGVNIRKVILYGSFAKGTQHEWSDIDVALVADDFSGIGFLDTPRFSRINVKKSYIRIEPKTYPTAYFQEGDPFIEEIKNTGIEII